jgi:ACT domain-containing protein
MTHIIIPIEMGCVSKLMPCLDKILHYEAQIKTITEDFNIEREARAKAHQRAEDLQEEVDRLKSQLEKQRQAIKQDASCRSRCAKTLYYECDDVKNSI